MSGGAQRPALAIATVEGRPVALKNPEQLLRTALLNARDRAARRGQRHPRWGAVMHALQVDKATAVMVCHALEIDPDQVVNA